MAERLDSEAAMEAGMAALAECCPGMRRLFEAGICPPLRRREPGFLGLAGIILSQQVSVASAAAIRARLLAAVDPFDAPALMSASDAVLRGCGVSAPKIRTLRAIAEAVLDGRLDLDGMSALSPEAAEANLVAIRGIGPWTAQIYRLFCLGDPDAFPAGDLALQEAARLAYGLPARPDLAALTDLAERWRPWRGVAAKTLWVYYAVAKTREGAPV